MNFIFYVTVILNVMFGFGFSAESNSCQGTSHLLFVI